MTNFFEKLAQDMTTPASCDPNKKPKPHGDAPIRTANSNWRAALGVQPATRLDIIVTGDPERVYAVGDALKQVEAAIFHPDSSGKMPNVETRVTAFLDGCMHQTSWSSKPSGGSAVRNWHCHESRKTDFADAFKSSVHSDAQAVIILGHKVTEREADLQPELVRLRHQGIKVFVLQVGDDSQATAAFQNMAEQTGGLRFSLGRNPDVGTIGEAVSVITEHMQPKQTPLALGYTPTTPLVLGLQRELLKLKR